jgi:hypothetical protein
MEYGDIFKLIFEDGNETTITIGLTGQYRIDLEIPIKKILLIKRARNINLATQKGYIAYSYYDIIDSEFSSISNISYLNIPATQIIGENESVLEYLGFVLNING